MILSPVRVVLRLATCREDAPGPAKDLAHGSLASDGAPGVLCESERGDVPELGVGAPGLVERDGDGAAFSDGALAPEDVRDGIEALLVLFFELAPDYSRKE